MLLNLLLACNNKKETIRKRCIIQLLFYQRHNFCKNLVLLLSINYLLNKGMF